VTEFLGPAADAGLRPINKLRASAVHGGGDGTRPSGAKMVSKPEWLLSMHSQDLLEVGLEQRVSSDRAQIVYGSIATEAQDMPNGLPPTPLPALGACGLGPERPAVYLPTPGSRC
jgi:hypothetical protein